MSRPAYLSCLKEDLDQMERMAPEILFTCPTPTLHTYALILIQISGAICSSWFGNPTPSAFYEQLGLSTQLSPIYSMCTVVLWIQTLLQSQTLPPGRVWLCRLHVQYLPSCSIRHVHCVFVFDCTSYRQACDWDRHGTQSVGQIIFSCRPQECGGSSLRLTTITCHLGNITVQETILGCLGNWLWYIAGHMNTILWPSG